MSHDNGQSSARTSRHSQSRSILAGRGARRSVPAENISISSLASSYEYDALNTADPAIASSPLHPHPHHDQKHVLRQKLQRNGNPISIIPSLFDLSFRTAQNSLQRPWSTQQQQLLATMVKIPIVHLRAMLAAASYTSAQLDLIETACPILQPETDLLWRQLCERDFKFDTTKPTVTDAALPKRSKTAAGAVAANAGRQPNSWRDFYKKLSTEREKSIKEIGEKLRKSYKIEEDRVHQLKVLQPSAVPRPTMRHSSFGSSSSSSSCSMVPGSGHGATYGSLNASMRFSPSPSTPKSSLMRKSQIEAIQSEARFGTLTPPKVAGQVVNRFRQPTTNSMMRGNTMSNSRGQAPLCTNTNASSRSVVIVRTPSAQQGQTSSLLSRPMRTQQQNGRPPSSHRQQQHRVQDEKRRD